MAKYRKKPVEVEAVQVTATDFNGTDFDGPPFSEMPDWLVKALEDKVVAPVPSDRDYVLWRVDKTELEPGDWIVREADGSLYGADTGYITNRYEKVD